MSDDHSWEPPARDLLKCNICYDRFKEPRVLPCLHSFCQSCLQRHIDINVNQGVFICPTCREPTALTKKGVEGFRKDFRVAQIEDLLLQCSADTSRSVNASYSSTADHDISCQFCDDMETAQHLCKDCCKFLCEVCTVKHRAKAVFSHHEIMNRSLSSNSRDLCRTHHQERVQYVCKTCHASICSVCVMTSFHDDHHVVNLSDGLDFYANNFSCLYDSLSERTSQLQHSLMLLNERQEQVEDHRTSTAKKVKERVDSLIENIHNQERLLLGEVNERCGQELKGIKEERGDIEQAVSEMTNIADLCSSFAGRPPLSSMVPIYGDLCDRIQTMLSDSNHMDNLKPRSRHLVNFKPEGRKLRLGRLHMQGEVAEMSISRGGGPFSLPSISLHTRLGRLGCTGGEFNSPRDVTFLGDDAFVVADTNNSRLQVFNLEGLLVSVIGEGQIKPWGVCTNAEGNIVVADNFDKCIKIYRPNGVLVNCLGKLLCPCGIAVNSKGEYIVTDFFSTRVFVIDTKGICVQQFEMRCSDEQHTCGASRVCIGPDDRIYISDISNACLKIFTSEGELLRVVTSSDHLVAPQGICFDHAGRLLVADAIKQDVVVFSADGDLCGTLMDSKHRLRDATGLDATRKHLIVSQLKSNQVKLCKLHYAPQ